MRDLFVYAIAVVPDLEPRRVKIGLSSNPKRRLDAFRVPCPTAVMLGVWKGDERDESNLHEWLDGRIGESEVFDLASVADSLAFIGDPLEAA